MLLQNKNAIIYGAGGAIGGAVARVFAREGATVFLTGNTLARVGALAEEISASGGSAEAAEVDTLVEKAVEDHARRVAERAGRIDISFNAAGIAQAGIQGSPLTELPLDSFQRPIAMYTTSQFLTARAAARHMVRQRSGVILTLTATPARFAAANVGGMAPAWAAVEALTRSLATELGPQGVRVVCLRPDAIPETETIHEVFGIHARTLGIRPEEFLAMAEKRTLLQRLPTLAQVAETAAFLASDHAGAMTGTIANLSCGLLVD